MNGLARTIAVGASGAALVLLLAASTRPAILAEAKGGLWEISGAPGSPAPRRLCIPDPALLAQFEHRNSSCTRVVIREQGSSADVHYTCSGGGFGQTSLTVLTPRSLRVHTQGISANAPFNYVIQARRISDC